MPSPRVYDLSIIIPAYCEEKRIGPSLEALANFLESDAFFQTKRVEVLVVAADSPDATHAIVQAKRSLFSCCRLLRPGPSRGKGHAVQYGMLRAKGAFIVFMDADLATPLYYLEIFYKACQAGADVVIGTRNPHKYRLGSLRRFVSNVGNILFRVAGGLWIEDSQCGFKMFRARAARLCFSKMTILRWGFDMEILTIAKVNKLAIKQYRIDDWQDMPGSTFTEGTIKNALRSLVELGRIVLNRLRGSYLVEDLSLSDQSLSQ